MAEGTDQKRFDWVLFVGIGSLALTGLVERSHLLSKDVNIDTHIADVVNLIKWEV